MRHLVLLALLAPASALAADHGLSFELGRLQNGDRGYDLFSPTNRMSSLGLRGSFAVHERVAVVGGWHRASTGQDLRADGAFVARSGLFSDAFTLGARADVQAADWLYPYVSLEALALRSVARFDDDLGDTDGPGQVAEAAFAPGGLAMAGFEVQIPRSSVPLAGKDTPITIGWFVEGGYGYVAPLSFERIGDIQPGGFNLRSGIGLRY